MKPCILWFPVTICYIICGIHGVWQNNGRGFIFRGLGGRAGQLHLRGKDSASGYNVGDTNYINNGDKTPIIVPLNGVEDSFDKGVKSSAKGYHELAPQLSVVGLNKEHGNGGLIGGESNANGYLNHVFQNAEGELQSNEMHSSEEEDHEFSSNSFNIVGETNDDGNVDMLMAKIVDDNDYDESQNNSKGSLNVGMEANADVNFSENSQNAELNIGGEGSVSNSNFVVQDNVNEKGGVYFYPPYNEGDFNIGAENFNLPTQKGFPNINVAAEGDIESGGFVKGNNKECSCGSKSNVSSIAAQGNVIHGLYGEGQVNEGGVLNSEILNGGGYNMGAKGILNSYYNFPVQNNKIHGFYNEWLGNEGRNLNIMKGVTNGYFEYPVQGVNSPNKGPQSGGGSYINFQHNNKINGLYAGGDPRLSGGGSGFNVAEVASSYVNYPVQYNAIQTPYHGDSIYFSTNGNGGRDINVKTQGGDWRGYNIAGQYYNLPKQDSLIQGFNTGGQIKEGSFNAKGNHIASNNYNSVIHGQNLAGNVNHELYTGGQSNLNGGLNVGIQNSGRFNIAAQDNRGVYNIEGKGLPNQGHIENLNLPGDNTNSNFNHASQNFIINGEPINKEISPYFKIEGDGKGGFYFVPFQISGCSCQNAAEFPIGNVTGQLKLPDRLNGGVQGNVNGKLETNVQINMGGGTKTDGLNNFEGNTMGKANLLNGVPNYVKSPFQGNLQTNIGGELVTGQLNNVAAYLAEQGKLTGELNNGVQNIVENRLDGSTQANIGGNLNTKFLVGDDNLNSQVNLGGFSYIKGNNIAQNKLMNGINSINGINGMNSMNGINGLDYLHQGINNAAGGFGDLGGHARWFSNFGSGIIPSWFENPGSGYTNFVGGLNTGGGIYGGIGNGYLHGMDSYNGILNNRAQLDGGFLGPKNKIDALNSAEFGHFKGQLNLIEENNDNPFNKIIVRKGNNFGGIEGKPQINLENIFKGMPQNNVNDGLSDIFKTIESRLDGDGFGTKGKPQINLENIFKGEPQNSVNGGLSDIFKTVGSRLDGDGFGPKGKTQTNLENIFKGKPQNNVNYGLSDIFKPIGSRLDGDGFRNAKEEFNNDKFEHFKFNDDITGVSPQWYQNNRNYLLKIVSPKPTEKLEVNHQVINRDQLNTSNRLGYSKGRYRFPKLGTIKRQRSFRPGYSGRIGRLRGYKKVFRG